MDLGSSAKTHEEKHTIENKSFLTGTLNVLNKIVNPVSRVLLVIAGTVAVAMMLLTFFDVTLRYSLNRPIKGSLEMTEFMMGILIAFGLGYCALRKGHIRVDLVLTYIPRRIAEFLDILTYFGATALYVLISWQTFVNASSALHGGRVSPALYTPIYPFVFLVMLGTIFLALVFIKDTVEAIQKVVKK